MIQTAVDYHRQGRLAEAERAYRAILAHDPNQFEALHYLGVLRLQQGHPAEAESLIARAVKIRPSATDAMGNLCGALLALDRHQEALAVSERILTGAPTNVQALFIRGVALMNLQRFREALAGFDQVLAIQPNHADAMSNRGNMLVAQGRIADALACFEKAIALNPGLLPAAYNRGNALLKLGRHAEALAVFTHLLSASPKNFDVMIGRSTALRELGRYEEALAGCDRVLAIDPDYRSALIARGNVLLKLVRPEDALSCYVRVLEQQADDVDALQNRGLALKMLGRYDAALESFDAALAINSNRVEILKSRGFLLLTLRREHEAIPCFERALVADPGDPMALVALVYGCLGVCDWDRVEHFGANLDAAIASPREVIPPHMLLQLSVGAADTLTCTRRFVARALPAVPKLPPAQPRARADKLRLAYVSGDFRRHPVGFLVPELFERHDRARFEVIGISFGPDDGSDIRARIVGGCDAFHEVGALSDRDAAQFVRDLGVDIAIDLMGHAENARTGILAARPAPVQVSYLGLLSTMGTDFIDYVLADKRVLPFDQQPFYSEQIVHLPDCFMVADSRPAGSPRVPTRAEAGLPEDGFVFASFNNSYKFRRPFFACWMRLLQSVEGSVLWLLAANEATAANLAREAALNGIDPARLILAPPVDLAEHLARQRLADLFLDTLPYNAGATGMAALWSGLPVLTMEGEGFVGRMAASMLDAVGLPELVTQNLADYEALARKLASDPALLASFHTRLDANRTTHSLFDTARNCRHIEAAYTTMWQTHQRGETPQSFTVKPIGA